MTPTVNDLTFQAATVNGSGSQSANMVLTRAIFSLGIPVAPKNVFPSNIEGLPTWYQLRVSTQGYQARKGDPDVLVALNPATWRQDLDQVRPGAAVIHQHLYSTADARTDVDYFPVPFTKLAKTEIQNDTLRKQLTNLIYVGVVAGLLEVPFEAIQEGIRRTFPTKPRAWQANEDAVRIGFKYWQENFSAQERRHVLRPLTSATDGKILLEGNQAAALGCIMGGCTVAAWYPITPSSSVCENLAAYADRYRLDKATGERRIAIVQAEDELAALGMAIGAGWAGARAMTSTSGPGISLMAEFSGLAYYAEIPVVIFDIQRIGPSTGLPTRTSQGDLAFIYTLSHGDTKHLVLLPGSVAECYEFAQTAFDLADRFQTPVFVLSDLDLGMNLWMSPQLHYPERPFDRGKVLSKDDLDRLEGEWGRYQDVDGDAVTYRTLPGTDHARAAYFTRGSGHDELARYTESAEAYAANMDRLARKLETARAAMPPPVVEVAESAQIGVIAFGSTHAAVVEARDELSEQGLGFSYLRVRALPLSPTLVDFVAAHERVYVIEQNRDGQLYDLIRLELPPELIGRLRSIRHYDGRPITAEALSRPLLELEAVPV
ncbi:2-oxoacid:acceptor oxidoreductase subunit alpha [Candidatus Dormiibacter inghamiae]|uniref:2-oxoacid:acceptor oxidoreductase subunit alpha n=1 Tax=Candidatus Dormiibacter inghamiae TaxID=3127013 RepID=UPI0030C70758